MILFQLLHNTTRTTPCCLKPQLISSLFTFHFSTSFFITKSPQNFRKKRKKKPGAGTGTTFVQTETKITPHFENILLRDAHFKFVTKTKDYLSRLPHQVLLLDDAGKLHQQLGFPRGRKITRYVGKYPSFFQIYRHTDNKMWLGFSDLMEALLAEEREIMRKMENERLIVVRKLLMMSANKAIPLSKIYHNRLLFGIPDNFRDWVMMFPEYFRVVIEEDGKRILELVKWDNSLAVSALEREFMVNEDKVKRAFKFPVNHKKALDEDDERNSNVSNALPLVSPYSDGSKLDLWSLEAEKYRIGVIHEFLSLTLEKRAYIHNIVEFKEEFSLTKHTYQMLLKQPKSFYLAGTEMNWCVFLKDAYGDDGVLINKDPQVVFNEKLYEYANKQGMDSSNDDIRNSGSDVD